MITSSITTVGALVLHKNVSKNGYNNEAVV